MPRNNSTSTDSDVPHNVVQQTTNYEQFQLIGANRDQNRGHIEAIKRAFEEIGNLTAVQPILVNEHYQIIDGQHRFFACKELGLPIYFTMQPGLGIRDARNMNILHRAWRLVDYAHSYAESGDQSYQKFLTLASDYDVFSYSVLMAFSAGEQVKGAFAGFRRGEFVFRDVPAARARLDKLTEAVAVIYVKDQDFCYAYLKVMQVPGFDQRRMVRKLSQVGEQLIRRFGNVNEYQRALEEVYNHQMSEGNRLRLY